MRQRQKNKRKGKLHLGNIDIREVLDDLHIYYTEAGKNVSDGWIGTSCPFCDDTSNHLGINLNSKTISCFKCGTSGTVIKYLSEELRDFSKAISILNDAVPRELRSFDQQQRGNAVHVELPKEAKREITPQHAGYLQERGFDYKALNDMYNLHYCGPISAWANRIIVPVIKNYRLITFTSADISDDSHLRYKHLSEEKSIISVKHHLFGLEHTDGHSVIVVEGLFDLFRIGEGCVATFGTKVTPDQKLLLSKFNVVKILFDGDAAGRLNGAKLADELAPFCDVRLFELPMGTDPDTMSPEDIEVVRSS